MSEARDLRALVAQRRKMIKLGAVAKNRLQSLLHRIQITPPADLDLYSEAAHSWWQSLPISQLERFRLGSDLDTLGFANRQVKSLDDCLGALAADEARIPLLVQIPGLGVKLAMTVLAAIGDITRFPRAKNLVGYAGLGARVHDSGDNQWSGRITKQGRRDLRYAMVQAAHNAIDHPKWRKELERLEPRIGRSKAMVAIARKLLVMVWHV